MRYSVNAVSASLLAIAVATGLMIPLSACEGQDHEKAPEKTSQAASSILAEVKELQIEDVKVGSGEEARSGSVVSVNYLGTLASNGEKFDSSYDRNQPFRFRLGAGQVIEGWEKGIQGMKVGGKRLLVIPASMAYGETGAPPVIPPNATLKFEVELMDIQ